MAARNRDKHEKTPAVEDQEHGAERPTDDQGPTEQEPGRGPAPDEGEAEAFGGELDEVGALRQQVAEVENRYKRALADYQNFQRRSIENEQRAREHGKESVVREMIPLIEHFKLALDMDPEKTSADQVLKGVRGIIDEFMRKLGAFGVATIEPKPGEEFDPMRHEAMMQVDNADVDPGCVVMSLQTGYEMKGRVVQAAKVSVRPGGDDNAGGGGDDDAGGDQENA